jgi:hypothetical protein
MPNRIGAIAETWGGMKILTNKMKAIDLRFEQQAKSLMRRERLALARIYRRWAEPQAVGSGGVKLLHRPPPSLPLTPAGLLIYRRPARAEVYWPGERWESSQFRRRRLTLCRALAMICRVSRCLDGWPPRRVVGQSGEGQTTFARADRQSHRIDAA